MTKLELINRINQVQAIRNSMSYDMDKFSELLDVTKSLVDGIISDTRELDNTEDFLAVHDETFKIWDNSPIKRKL